MGIITVIRNIKAIHTKDIVFVKLGKFYSCYGKDSYIISYFFEYKLNLVENMVYSCGFPTESLNKVIAKLEDRKINYIIVDRRNNYEVEERENFKNLNSYDKYYNEAKEKIGIKIRIQKINNYLLNNINKPNIKKILNALENMLKKISKEEL